MAARNLRQLNLNKYCFWAFAETTDAHVFIVTAVFPRSKINFLARMCAQDLNLSA